MNELPVSPAIIIFFSIWSLIWKGLSLWRSAKLDQKNWFVAILIVNLFGILEIIYLFKFAKKPLTIKEIKSWMPKNK